MASQEEILLISKLRVIKNYFEKTYVTGASCLWLVATFWDIYKLQRYWFDYAIELYTSLIIFLMMIYSIYPKAIPYKIYDSFKIITKMKGRGILLLLISFLFLADNHLFHRLCAFVLLFAGILCFLCELLLPTSKEELLKISESYDKKRHNKIIDNIQIKNTFEMNKNMMDDVNKSNNEEKIDDNVKNNKISINDINAIKINEEGDIGDIEVKNEEGKVSVEEKLENNNSNNQSANPYDLPDDF